jgi:hypothetical protein
VLQCIETQLYVHVILACCLGSCFKLGFVPSLVVRDSVSLAILGLWPCSVVSGLDVCLRAVVIAFGLGFIF